MNVTLESVRKAVCAVGYLTVSMAEYDRASLDAGAFDVVGTGFLIGRRRAVTCAHVIHDLRKEMKKRGFPSDRAMLQFVLPKNGLLERHGRPFQLAESDDTADIATLEVQGPAIDIAPVRLVAHDDIPTVGEEAGLCGYAHGAVLLRRGKSVARFGPVLQRGIVAAISPFDSAEPESYLLDLVTGHAASGSPVFRFTTGDVFGVITAGQFGKTAALAVARSVYRYADGNLGARVTSRIFPAGEKQPGVDT